MTTKFQSIGLFLAPYSNIIAKICEASTCVQFLSGFFMLQEIWNKNTTEGFNVWFFLGGIALSVICLKFGFIIRDDAMIKVNFVGFALNIFFMIFFYTFTPNKNKGKLWGQIGLTGLFVVACLAYTEWEDKDLIEARLGTLITVIIVFLVSSPLFNLGNIIKNKSTEGLPFPMILIGTFVSASWMLYGFSILNEIMVIQNSILLFISLIQLSLFAIYPSKSRIEKVEKKTN